MHYFYDSTTPFGRLVAQRFRNRRAREAFAKTLRQIQALPETPR